MRQRTFVMLGVAAAIALASFLVPTLQGQVRSEATPAAIKTEWGEPDLQGIWTDPYQIQLQRPARYANKEFFTDQEREEIDRQRAALLRREVRVERGTEKDVAG